MYGRKEIDPNFSFLGFFIGSAFVHMPITTANLLFTTLFN